MTLNIILNLAQVATNYLLEGFPTPIYTFRRHALHAPRTLLEGFPTPIIS